MKTQNLRNAARPANAFNSDRSHFKPKDPVDLIVSLFEKGLNSKSPFIKSKYAVDPVNNYVEGAFNIKVSSDDPKHPIDEFYDSINIELSNRRPFVKPSRPLDVANSLTKSLDTGSASDESRQKIEKLFNSLKELYSFSGKSSYTTDPINDEAKRLFGSVPFSLKPKHSYKEVIDLVKKSLGPAYRSINPSYATDKINDVAADQLGTERPSVKSLSVVQDKLMGATYELAYKLTPGSEEYINKAKEIEQLKEERKILMARQKV